MNPIFTWKCPNLFKQAARYMDINCPIGKCMEVGVLIGSKTILHCAYTPISENKILFSTFFEESAPSSYFQEIKHTFDKKTWTNILSNNLPLHWNNVDNYFACKLNTDSTIPEEYISLDFWKTKDFFSDIVDFLNELASDVGYAHLCIRSNCEIRYNMSVHKLGVFNPHWDTLERRGTSLVCSCNLEENIK
jgi:hypothetical protein